jgi:predicted nucleic acid-binding protein
MLVLDCSVALSWYFEDEQSPFVMQIMDRVIEDGAVVPAIWRYEIANCFQSAIRRRRIDALYRDESLKSLISLDIEIEAESLDQVWTRVAILAGQYRLSVYDAAYLELAQRRALPLATLDEALAQAAREAGVVALLHNA